MERRMACGALIMQAQVHLGRTRKGMKALESKTATLIRARKNLGVLCGEDPQLDLNNPRRKIEVPRGIRECWKLTSACTICERKCIMAYEYERRYLKE